MDANILLACMLLVTLAPFTMGDTLSISAFNVQIFGKTKWEKPKVKKILIQVRIVHCDFFLTNVHSFIVILSTATKTNEAIFL